jgi:hypothetical protein
MPQSPEELFSLCLKAKEAGLDCNLAYFSLFGVPYAFHRTYDAWPFYTDGVFLYDEQGNVSSYFESDVFEKDAAWMRRFREADLLTVPRNYIELEYFRKDWKNTLASFGSFTTPNSLENDKAANVDYIQFEPNKPNIETEPSFTNLVVVNSQSAHPDVAMAVINAIYTDKEIYEAFMYGDDGVDVKIYEDGSFEWINDSINVFAYGHAPLNRINLSGDDKFPYFRNTRVKASTIIDFPAVYFASDDSLAMIQQIKARTEYNGKWGLLGYRDGLTDLADYEKSLAALKQMGLDEAVALCGEQYRAFIGVRD